MNHKFSESDIEWANKTWPNGWIIQWDQDTERYVMMSVHNQKVDQSD